MVPRVPTDLQTCNMQDSAGQGCRMQLQKSDLSCFASVLQILFNAFLFFLFCCFFVVDASRRRHKHRASQIGQDRAAGQGFTNRTRQGCKTGLHKSDKTGLQDRASQIGHERASTQGFTNRTRQSFNTRLHKSDTTELPGLHKSVTTGLQDRAAQLAAFEL